MDKVKAVAGPVLWCFSSAQGLKCQQTSEPSLFHAATALSIPEELTSPQPSFKSSGLEGVRGAGVGEGLTIP